MKFFSIKSHIITTILLILFILNLCIFFVYADSNLPLSNVSIIIDPGHGGFDPGKISDDNILEKDLNLQISLKLKSILEAYGCEVTLTRNSDTALNQPAGKNSKYADMNQRISISEEVKPDYIISIHQNSYPDPTVKGAQVFYFANSPVSRTLAEAIQSFLVSDVDPKNHRLAKSNNDYYMLTKSSCPAVIVECGFLSCPSEAKKLCSDSYQTKIANAIADALIKEHSAK